MTLSAVNNKLRSSGDPLRDALVAALREARESNEAVRRQREAIEQIRGRVFGELPAAAKKAQEAVEAAQRDYAVALADAAANGSAPPASGVKAARQAVQDAQEEVDAQKAALAQLRADLPAWENDAREKQIVVEKAISLILAREVQPLLERARKILREFIPYRILFNALVRGSSISSHEGKADAIAIRRGHEPFDEATRALNQFLQEARAVDDRFPDIWQETRERLRADPYAALPNFAELS
jgi:hypothetical protein